MYETDGNSPRQPEGRRAARVKSPRRGAALCALLALVAGLAQGCGLWGGLGRAGEFKPLLASPAPAGSPAPPAPVGAPPPVGAQPATPPPDEARPGNPAAWGETSRNAVERKFETVYFYPESAELDAPAKQRLSDDAAWLRQHSEVWITLIGHAGTRTPVEYAYNLGMARALAAADFLAAQGVDRRHIFTISMGRDLPADASGTDQAESINHRVEVLGFMAPVGQAAPDSVAREKTAPPPPETPPARPWGNEL